MVDPRIYQIATLASLLVYGFGWLHFVITLPRIVLLLSTSLATLAACDRRTVSRFTLYTYPTSISQLVASLHLRHVARPIDDTRFEGRPSCVRGDGRVRREVRAVPAVQNQRTSLFARCVVDGSTVHRTGAPRPPLFMVVA